MTTILEKLIQNIAPHECILCCNENYVICPACAVDVVDESFSHCFLCEAPTLDYAVCRQCSARSPISHAFVLGGYIEELKQLVGLLKFDHVRQVANDIAMVWNTFLPIFSETTFVTHIPTSGQRQRQRGFDQAQLLARGLAKQRGLPYKAFLSRIGSTKQIGASRRQRALQATQMFKSFEHLPEGSTVLLVDDVITTGATIQAAASLLRRAGAGQVVAVAIARQHLEK